MPALLLPEGHCDSHKEDLGMQMLRHPKTVFDQDRDDFRGQLNQTGKVARRCLVDRQRQEWSQQLRNSPCAWRHAKDRLVHAPAYQAGHADGYVLEICRAG